MRIRTAAIADRDTVLKWINNEVVWAVDSPDPYQTKSREEFGPSWREIVDMGSAWIMEVDDKPVGHLGWVPQRQAVGEFYIVIGEPDYWGMGYGRQAMEWMLSEAALRELKALYGRVLGHNIGALKFFTAMGFDQISKDRDFFERDGAMHDLHWIARKVDDHCQPISKWSDWPALTAAR